MGVAPLRNSHLAIVPPRRSEREWPSPAGPEGLVKAGKTDAKSTPKIGTRVPLVPKKSRGPGAALELADGHPVKPPAGADGLRPVASRDPLEAWVDAICADTEAMLDYLGRWVHG